MGEVVDGLAGAVLAGQMAQREMQTPAGLREVASRLCMEAIENNINYFVAASPAGATLIGAAAMLSDREFQIIDISGELDPTGNAMVVDAVAITHSIVDSCVNDLIQRGVSHVVKFLGADLALARIQESS